MEPITAQEPLAQTADLAAENLERLRQLFPSAVTEDGVDLEVLRELLGGAAATGEERYGLHWHGKRQARQLALMPSTGTLRPAPAESEKWDTTQNLMIEGDNLEVLKLLQKSYAGQVKLIYIDPPYNTGKDFVYPDNFKNPLGNYLELTGQVQDGEKMSSNTETSGRFHTHWLNMMYPRLKVARSLMREDGVIFLSIDDAEFANLKKICDEIFGEENQIGVLVMQTATDNNPTQINTEHEYMLAYGRNASELPDWGRKSEKAKLIHDKYLEIKRSGKENPAEIQVLLRQWIRSNKEDLDGVSHYDNVDSQGVFHDGDIANTKFGGYKYDVIHPITGKACKVPEKGFRFPQKTLAQMIAQGDIMFGADETTLIKPKKRVENAREMMRSVIYEDGRAATKRLDSLLSRGVFDNPKSETMIARIIDFVTEKNDLVMDFFAGSGTTGHAVMAHNANDDGNRRYILVQLPEPLDPTKKEQKTAADYCDTLSKPRTIAELTKERLRRAARKVQADKPSFKGDLGFRVYRLASSNIKAWRPEVKDLRQTLIDYEDNLDTKRTDEDLLTELQLKLGLPLTTPIEVRELPGGHKLHSLGAGTLLVCLSRLITKEDAVPLATAISDWHQELAPAGDSQVLFRDSAFAGDESKTNLAAQLRQLIDRVQVRSL